MNLECSPQSMPLLGGDGTISNWDLIGGFRSCERFPMKKILGPRPLRLFFLDTKR
jgi:hypothetical protein